MNQFAGLINSHPASRWEEAYPCGNGTIGMLVFGSPADETVIFNHERLFLPLPENARPGLPEMSEDLPELRRLIKAGSYREGTEYFIRRMVEKGASKELVWTDPFHPAFDLHVRARASQGEPGAETVREYERTLDFESGEAKVRFRGAGGNHARRMFVSRAHGIAVLEFQTPKGRLYDFEVAIEERPGRRLVKDPEIRVEGSLLLFRALYTAGPGGYEAAVRAVPAGGSATPAPNGLRIAGSTGLMLLVDLAPLPPERPADSAAPREHVCSIEGDYDSLLTTHAAAHREMYRRVRIELDAEGERLRTNEELLSAAGSGAVPAALFERMHDFGRYLLIASSGELPPNLQGVWNGSWTPPWSSDYTLDENLQMMMWPALPGNLSEAAMSCFDLIESYLPDWETNAARYYGCRGILSSARASRGGLHRHFSVDYPLMFWTAGAGWFAQLFYDYWLFSGDRTFLRERAVPYMIKVAEFYEDFLEEGEDGRLEFVPSYSPENTPANSDSSASRNATMDVAVAKELLGNLCDACATLDVEPGRVEKWRRMRSGLPDYTVNSDGALKEWCDSSLEDDYHHRHSSHLYPVFPGFEVTPESHPELYRAALRAAELRLGDGLEAISGWGLTHLANIAARLREPGLLEAALSRVVRKFTLSNLFTAHNEGSIFQMDANLGFTAAIMESLVTSSPGRLVLLPALPSAFPRGEAAGIRCRGRVTLLALRWDTATVQATLVSDIDQRAAIEIPSRLRPTRVRRPGRLELRTVEGGSSFRVSLPAGEPVEIEVEIA